MDRIIKILLIDLGSSRKEINEPIGICAVAAFVQEYARFPVDIDLRFFPISEKPTKQELSTYHVIGLSTKIGSLNKIHQIYNEILQLSENCRPLLVLGDLLATFATKEILGLFNQAICVTGEGEEGFLELLNVIYDSGISINGIQALLLESGIPNIAFIMDGKYVKSDSRLIDLETCPSPLRAFSKQVSAMGGIVRSESSRGCAWGRCSFCAIQHKYCNEIQWRPVSVERIIQELEELSNLGIKSPFYTDEDFIGNDPERAIKLSAAIIDAKRTGRIDENLNLYVDMRADFILSKAHKGKPSGKIVLSRLKEAGLREVFIGIESGANEQVKRYKKAATAERNVKVLNVLDELQITYDIGFIMFDPEMDIDELEVNIDFLSRTGLNRHDARMTKSLRIEPGTPIAEEYKEKNMIEGNLDVDQLIYPYSWKHSTTHDIYEIYSAWEKELADEVYTIQAATRGEIESERLRKEWRTKLGEIREVELAALSYIVGQLKSGKNVINSSLMQLQELRNEKIHYMNEVIKRA